MKSTLGIILLITVLFSTCQKKHVDTNKTPILEINGQFLYEEDLPKISFRTLSEEDSIKVVDNYIKRWITDVVMYDYAKKNVQNPKEIETLVDEYRKTLIIQYYQQNIVNQRLESPSEEELKSYYEKYSSQFLLEENIIKGVFIKIPTKTARIKDLYKWLSDIDEENLEKMEKFCVRNYGTLDYFQEEWFYATDVLKKFPETFTDEKTVFTAPNVFERTDSVFTYLLKVTDYHLIGNVAPYDFASKKIESILLNQKRIDFIRNFEEELYKDALKKVKFLN